MMLVKTYMEAMLDYASPYTNRNLCEKKLSKCQKTMAPHRNHSFSHHVSRKIYIEKSSCTPSIQSSSPSLLITTPKHRHITMFQPRLQKLINSKSNRLPRRNPHDPRCDSLIKRMKPFLSKHIRRDRLYPTQRRLTGYSRGLL